MSSGYYVYFRLAEYRHLSVLYERLSTVPPSPDVHDRHAYPAATHVAPGAPIHQSSSRSHSASHHHRDVRDFPPSIEPERMLAEYVRPQDNPRVPPGVDRSTGMPPLGLGLTPSHHLSGMHSPPRRVSGGPGHESQRSLPHLVHIPPVQHMEPSRGHAHPRSHASPTLHHSHSSSSHHRTRSHSSSRSRAHHAAGQPYHPGHPQQYPENLPPVQHVLSPPLSERERERPRRHELHEIPGVHVDRHARQSMAQHSPPVHPAEVRSSGRIHNHQRTGPGTYLNREELYDRHRDRDIDVEREREHERERERDWDHERSRDLGHAREVNPSHFLSPPTTHRSRQPAERGDYQEQHVSSRTREEQTYYHDAPAPAGYSIISRSGSPGSGSGSGSGIGAGDVPSRPDSRTQYYEADRARSFRLRPVNQPTEEVDFVHEDGRSISRDRGGGGGGNFPLPEQSRSSLETRKRTRHDMEIDSENDVADGPAGGGAYASGRPAEDRGSKRYHREHRRSVDNQEDSRMGPP